MDHLKTRFSLRKAVTIDPGPRAWVRDPRGEEQKEAMRSIGRESLTLIRIAITDQEQSLSLQQGGAVKKEFDGLLPGA